MKDLLNKLSSNNIFNDLLPGVINSVRGALANKLGSPKIKKAGWFLNGIQLLPNYEWVVIDKIITPATRRGID